MNPFVNEFPVYETLANGNAIIIIYDLFIMLLFCLSCFYFTIKNELLKK